MRRWRKRLSTGGYAELLDRRTRRPSAKRIEMAVVEKVLRLYREKYFDLNVKHFVEKLQREEQISLSYTWVKTALQNAGLGSQRYRKRGAHRKKRPTPAADGDDAACGWEPSSMDSGVGSIPGLGRDFRRCHQRSLRRAVSRLRIDRNGDGGP